MNSSNEPSSNENRRTKQSIVPINVTVRGNKLVPKELPVKKLQVDDAYQRWIEPEYPSLRRHIEKKGLRLEGFGRLIVGRRSDGSYWVVDGQRRLFMASLSGWKTVPCDIFESNGRDDEADVFVLVNKERKRVTSVSNFHACICAGSKQHLRINAQLEQHGLCIGIHNERSYPYIKSVDRFLKMDDAGVFPLWCQIVTRVVKQCPDQGLRNRAVQGRVTTSIAVLLLNYTGDLDADRLADKVYSQLLVLRNIPVDTSVMEGASRSKAMAKYLIKCYNSKLSAARKIYWQD